MKAKPKATTFEPDVVFDVAGAAALHVPAAEEKTKF